MAVRAETAIKYANALKEFCGRYDNSCMGCPLRAGRDNLGLGECLLYQETDYPFKRGGDRPYYWKLPTRVERDEDNNPVAIWEEGDAI